MNRTYKSRSKNRKKKTHPFLKIFILVVLCVCVYLGYEYKKNGNLNNVVQVISKINLTKLNLEEQNYSSNNDLSGKVSVDKKDGYTTIFTTLNEENKKTYKEYKQNLKTASWSEKNYWGGTMRKNGCGITSMAIIASRI